MAKGAREALVTCGFDILRRRWVRQARGGTEVWSAGQVSSAAPASVGASRQSSARECTRRRLAEIAIYVGQLVPFSDVCTCVAYGLRWAEVAVRRLLKCRKACSRSG